MRLYLVRHCEAVHPVEDGARPLSDEGRRQAARLAAFFPRSVGVVNEVRHSGILRAQQTAEIIAGSSQPKDGIHLMHGLRPDDSARSTAEILRHEKGPLVIVSHMPFVAELASELLGGHTRLAFHTGSVAALHGDGGWWEVDWLVRPSLLPPVDA